MAAVAPVAGCPVAASVSVRSSGVAVAPVDLDTSDRSMAGCSRALLALQSKTIEALTQSVLSRHLVTRQMRSYLSRLSLDVDSLPIVHIAGTKGKGSTGAFTERILREHGLRTALYTSPHLVHITERFRLDGVPISDDLYVHHFWAVWDGLVATQHLAEDNPPIPSYFRFLTLVAYHLFLTHQPALDVVILEVGLGGKLDATNVIQRPVVCGLASIGYDHMEVLGYTLTEIAHEKAGIIKHEVPVFSVASQAAEVQTVLTEVATTEHAELTFVPSLPTSIELGLAGNHQHENAGLACRLAHAFLRHRTLLAGDATTFPAILDPTNLPNIFLDALRRTCWPGRCQILAHPSPQLKDRVTFFIDGAHTGASMQIACNWLQTLHPSAQPAVTERRRHILLFNCGHIRDPIELMIPLVALAYPNLALDSSSAASSASASTAADTPTRFERVFFAPFDHDRPHFASAPTFERLLQNYLLTRNRANNATAAAAAELRVNEANPSTIATVVAPSTISEQIHPVLLQYLMRRFDFPSPPPVVGSTCALTIAAAQRSIATIVVASSSSSAALSTTAPLGSWQHTLAQVWSFLTSAFADAASSSDSTIESATPPHSVCSYSPSVRSALGDIEQLATNGNSDSLSVFVTGSLYVVGNVLSALDFHI